jgi:hypothetical protein
LTCLTTSFRLSKGNDKAKGIKDMATSVSGKQSSWQDRAKEGVQKTAEFMAEHGTQMGLAGGSVLLAMGVASQGFAMGADSPAEISAYREGASALISAAMIKMAAFAGAEQAAKLHLRGVENTFDDASYRKAAYGADGEAIYVDPRSSAPITTMNDQDVLADLELQVAMQTVFKEIGDDQSLREKVEAMIEKSPEQGRETILTAKKQIDEMHAKGEKAVESIDLSRQEKIEMAARLIEEAHAGFDDLPADEQSAMEKAVREVGDLCEVITDGAAQNHAIQSPSN